MTRIQLIKGKDPWHRFPGEGADSGAGNPVNSIQDFSPGQAGALSILAGTAPFAHIIWVHPRQASPYAALGSDILGLFMALHVS